jgi:hypothetical protein
MHLDGAVFVVQKYHPLNLGLVWYDCMCVDLLILETCKKEKENGEVVRDTTFLVGWEARNYISGFKGSQAVPTHLSGKGNAYDRN